jgi:hypothetical protein
VELYEAESLMLPVDAIDGHIDVPYSASVEHQLMKDAGCDALMEVSNVDCCFLILFPEHALAYVQAWNVATYQ